MARFSKPSFVSNETIVAELCKPHSLGWIAARFNVSLERLRSVRDEHKTEIVNTRIKEHHQTIDSICYQLDLLLNLDSLRHWYKLHYGDSHENRRHGSEQK